jgi:hypothetical protein
MPSGPSAWPFPETGAPPAGPTWSLRSRWFRSDPALPTDPPRTHSSHGYLPGSPPLQWRLVVTQVSCGNNTPYCPSGLECTMT